MIVDLDLIVSDTPRVVGLEAQVPAPATADVPEAAACIRVRERV